MSVPFFAWKNGSWVRSTPAFDGKNLYVGGMRDFLVCLDASNGSQKWSVDFMKRYKAPFPLLGSSVPPWSRASTCTRSGGGRVRKVGQGNRRIDLANPQ